MSPTLRDLTVVRIDAATRRLSDRVRQGGTKTLRARMVLSGPLDRARPLKPCGLSDGGSSADPPAHLHTSSAADNSFAVTCGD